MNKSGGFISLHRQILDWEWYSDANTFCLFVHLLLIANYVDGRFKGRVIKRGQVVTSLHDLSTKTGLSIQQTKTALKHLQLTGEITNESTSGYRIITVVKYDQFQTPTNLSTSDQQTTNKRANKQLTNELTSEQQQYNNNNNITKEQDNNNARLRSLAQRFEDFWSAYPKRTGKENAKKAFAKIDPDEELLTDMIIAIGRQKVSRQWQENGGQFIPYPATWLNGHRWEDDVQEPAPQPAQQPAPAPRKTVVAQQYEQRDYKDEQAEAMARMIAMYGGGG